MNTPDVSIVIVSYNVAELLLGCIRSIAPSAGPYETEIIVVDNHSSDNTVEQLKKHFSTIKLIENKQNTGFSFANNQGIDVATGRYVLLLNPDTAFIGDALEKMIRYADEHRETAVIAPQLLNENGSLQISCWKPSSIMTLVSDLFYIKKIFNSQEYPQASYSQDFEPSSISGAAIFVQREVIKTIGGLDPILFWMEDIDFSLRITKAGFRKIYLSTAQVFHYSGKSAASNKKVAITNQLLSKVKFFRKHNGSVAFVVSALLVLSIILQRLFIYTLLSLFSSQAKSRVAVYRFAYIKWVRYIFLNDLSIA